MSDPHVALDSTMPPAVDPRDLLANERTLLAWIRTGLSFMAFGFVVERLAVWLGAERPVTSQRATLVIGAVIVALGAGCQLLGALRYVRVRRALREGRTPLAGTTWPVLLAVMTAVTGVALLAYLLAT